MCKNLQAMKNDDTKTYMGILFLAATDDQGDVFWDYFNINCSLM